MLANSNVLITNGLLQNQVGYFAFDVGPGGASGSNQETDGARITAQGTSQFLQNEQVLFDFLNYVAVGGASGDVIQLNESSITMGPTLMPNQHVISQGTFDGDNGQEITWIVDTSFADGNPNQLINRVSFRSTSSLGTLQFINYLDQDVIGNTDDILRPSGVPGDPDFQVFTLDGPQHIGFGQGGVYEPGADLVNAIYDGWAADEYSLLQSQILDSRALYSVEGNITVADLQMFNDPDLGTAYGPNDVTTAFAWSVDSNATSATITTFLQLVPHNPAPSLLHGPIASNASTLENTKSSSGLVLSPDPADSGLVTNFQITNISGGRLYQHNGVTPISNNEFITVAEGAAGLVFNPTTNSIGTGSFDVQESTTGDALGVGGAVTSASITVIPLRVPLIPRLGSPQLPSPETAQTTQRSMLPQIVRINDLTQSQSTSATLAARDGGASQVVALAQRDNILVNWEERDLGGGAEEIPMRTPNVVMVQFQTIIPDVQTAELSDTKPDLPELPELRPASDEGLIPPRAPIALLPPKVEPRSWYTALASGIALAGSLLVIVVPVLIQRRRARRILRFGAAQFSEIEGTQEPNSDNIVDN